MPKPVTPQDEIGAQMIDYYRAAREGRVKPEKYVPIGRRADQPGADLRAHIRQAVMGEPPPAPEKAPLTGDPRAEAFARLEPEVRERVIRKDPVAEAEYARALAEVEQEYAEEKAAYFAPGGQAEQNARKLWAESRR